LQAFQSRLGDLEAAGAQVLGVSMDSPFANKAFAESIGVTFPLLSDWGGKVTKEYGLFVEDYGAPRRVTYVIDLEGRITSMQVYAEAVDPSALIDACTVGKKSTPPGR
jgi:peroxiredoxin (alkyl hydroperoxide reductase subunit C)